MTEKQITYHITFPEDPRVQTLKLDETNRLAPLKLKTRADIYRKEKKQNPTTLIKAILYPLTWDRYQVLVNDNSQTAKNHYLKMQPPVMGVDCDEVALATGTEEIENILTQQIRKAVRESSNFDEHDNPHHKETISEHISMVNQFMGVHMALQNKLIGDQKPNHLKEYDQIVHCTSAYYHDLGKYWAKTYDPKIGHSRFSGHENLSAVIFFTSSLQGKTHLNKLGNGFERSVADVTQAILNHMIVKTLDFNNRVIKRRGLTPYQVKLTKTLSEIDNQARKE